MKADLEQTKITLDKVSPTFCLIKWKHTSLNFAQQSIKNCCHNPASSVKPKDPDPTNQSQDLRIRSQMLNGERPKECSYCWEMEDRGQYSDRILWSQMSWMRDFRQQVVEHNSPNALDPSWLEVSFSSTCNLKCSYCNPGVSTSWLKEIETFGPYPTLQAHNSLRWFNAQGLIGEKNQEEVSSLDLSLEKWLAQPSQLRLLTITGGEPLLSTKTFTLLERLEKEPNPQLQIAINSNCCLPEAIWNKFTDQVSRLKKNNCIKELYLHPSLDSWGARAEYIRYGLSLLTLQKNVATYRKKTTGGLVVNCTLNNLSLGGIKEFLQYILELKKLYRQGRPMLSFNFELLVGPEWQRIDILPKTFEHYLFDAMNFMITHKDEGGWFTEHEVNGIKRAIDFFGKVQNDEPALSRNRINFYRFFSEHDRRRNTDFLKTFPELSEFWQQCKEESAL